jgi:hypothetical protein
MPTGAKAMSAISFAVVGWLLANAYVPNMPQVQPVGLFRELTALIGLVVGWKVMGTSVGKGYIAAAGAGLKTVIVLIFMALLLFATYEMLLKSVKMVYDGPMDAVLDIFLGMYDRAGPLVSTGVVTVMVVGGMIGGILAENANRRWT